MMLICAFLLATCMTAISAQEDPLKFTNSKFTKLYRGKYYMSAHTRDVVNISCQTNNPKATVTFYIVKNPVKMVIVQNGQNFSIHDVTLHHNGICICKASYGNDTIQMSPGILQVSETTCVEIPKIKGNISVRTFEKNEDFSLNCMAPGDLYNPTLSWVKIINSIETSLQSSREIVSRSKQTDKQYIVRTLKFTLANQNMSGTYTCVRNVSGCQPYQTKRTTVELRYTDPYPPISIKDAPMHIYDVNIHSNITMKCHVKASPTPNMKWVKHGKVQKQCNYRRTCNLFVNVEESSKGDYVCIAENSEGSIQSKCTMTVQVPPKVKPGSYNPEKGRLLTCEIIRGYPQPVLYWQQETVSCIGNNCTSVWRNVSGKLFKVSGVGSTSELEILDNSAHGTFRCVGINSLGNDVAKLILPKNISGEPANSRDTIIGSVCSVLFLIILCILVMMCYRKYLKKKYALYMHPDPKFQLDPDRTLFEQSIELPYDQEWEFPRERLSLIRSLGAGAFGQVWLAHAHGVLALSPRDKDSMAIRRRTRLRLNKKVPKTLLNCFLDDDLCEQSIFVAVKTLKPDPSDVEYKDLASEIKVLIHLGSHENVVNLLGACTKGGNLCAIIEYCPYGNLVSFLRDRRDIFSLQWARQGDNYQEDFCFLDATYVALQVARGMQFLAEKKLVHRDLAARNILVGADYTMKIADFGLTRDVYGTEFYLKESSGMLPVKWMAPESLFDKLYTIKSDVWSFGIVLWEICTMGGSPYPGLPMENLFEYLQRGNRMEKPATSPDELYEIMELCWLENMNERPYFYELISQLERIFDSKTVISNNLATFERIKSCSSESDYLIPQSPAKKKKGSLDTMLLSMKSLSTPFNNQRKKSVDFLINFPPMDDPNASKSNNNDKLKGELSPICENKYVDLATANKPDQEEDQEDWDLTLDV